jgi:hypothetical protein
MPDTILPTQNTHAPSSQISTDSIPFDPSFWGSQLTQAKPPDTMRLILQNPYGLDANHNFRKLDYIARNMTAYHADITCLPETNVPWYKPSVLKPCHAILRKHFKHHRLVTSSSPAAATNHFLPGGTACIVANEWTGRLATVGSDPRGLGRWSFIRVKGKNNSRVLIVTIYQVCKTSINAAGDSTAFSQQWHLLKADGDENPNPRSAFSSDLSLFLAAYPNDAIILAGDINSWLRNPADDLNFSNLVTRYNLKDALIRKHGPDSEIPTRKSGCRIDYIFVSEVILDHVTSCGALHFDRIVDSDHRALFIDINIDPLLGGTPPTLASPALRGIVSTEPKSCKVYLSALVKHLTEHHVHERVTQLEAWTATHGLTPLLQAKWEGIDRDVTAGCLFAERIARQRDQPPWSLALHTAHLSVVYLKICISALRKNKDPITASALFLETETGFTPPEADGMHNSILALQVAKSTLKDIRKNATAHRESFLEERAAAAAAAKQDIPHEQALNAILKQEGTKKAYQTLRRYLCPGEFSRPDGGPRSTPRRLPGSGLGPR